MSSAEKGVTEIQRVEYLGDKYQGCILSRKPYQRCILNAIEHLTSSLSGGNCVSLRRIRWQFVITKDAV
jgi:hypothetical protein